MSSWIELYADGSCLSNPGPGGWAFLLRYHGHEKEAFGGEPYTTNNRMELLAIVRGLQAVKKPSSVSVYSDSQWAIFGALGRNAHKTHFDLWADLAAEKARHKEILFNWVRGHATHPENLRVDRLALAAARAAQQALDTPDKIGDNNSPIPKGVASD